MLDDRMLVPENSMIPDTEGAAVVTTTVNVMADVEDKQTH